MPCVRLRGRLGNQKLENCAPWTILIYGIKSGQTLSESSCPYGSLLRACSPISVAPTSSRSLRLSILRSVPIVSHRCRFLLQCQFSRMSPAMVRPFPTPAPAQTASGCQCDVRTGSICPIAFVTILFGNLLLLQPTSPGANLSQMQCMSSWRGCEYLPLWHCTRWQAQHNAMG